MHNSMIWAVFVNKFNQINPYINQLISAGISENIWFASHNDSHPENAFLVKFSRVIYVLEGQYRNAMGVWGERREIIAQPGEVTWGGCFVVIGV